MLHASSNSLYLIRFSNRRNLPECVNRKPNKNGVNREGLCVRKVLINHAVLTPGKKIARNLVLITIKQFSFQAV